MVNNQEVLTAQESSSRSLSMQGRFELELETPELSFTSLSPPVFFSSIRMVVGSALTFSASVQEKNKGINFYISETGLR